MMTAGEIASAVRPGEITASAIVAEALQRINEDETNSFISVDDQARSRAQAIDEAVAKGEDPGPLAGVPVALKDLIDHEGRTNTAGSAFYRNVPDSSAPVVGLLKAAGAIIIGRANLHEFAFGFDSENQWFGPVRNPWDLTTSAGGSSGGSATAVAAGLVPLSLGTDTGGSVRVPAAMTGTFGLKVTHGAIPTRGVFPLVPSCDTVGPFATSASDLTLIHSVLAVHDPEDPNSRQSAHTSRPIRRVGVPHPWIDDAPTSKSVSDDFAQALSSLAGKGIEVVDITIPELLPPGRIVDAIGQEVSDIHRGWVESGKRYGDSVLPRIEAALAVDTAASEEALQWRADTRRATRQALSEVDALITPAVANTKKTIGDDKIDGRNARTVISYFSAIVNHVDLPALSLPLAISKASPPTSIQVVGDDWSETDLLAFGQFLEDEELVGFRAPSMNSQSSENEI
ncbi:MAG: hypothetical protein GEU79_16450 [Acidimicrobiia bacterium]|nr:hypothetical protein [Acidimicrobiia bacterium]